MAKIMLVEDDTNLSEIYQARMAAEGYEIVTAHDGEEALATAAKEKPDLIISDVMMPKISGFEMLDILRNTEGLKTTKVIMLTALGQADDKKRAEGLGADRYLVKSQVTLEDIVKAAHELLNDDASATTAAPAAAPATPAPAAAPVAPPPAPAVQPAPAPAALAPAPPMPQPVPRPAPTTPAISTPVVPAPAPAGSPSVQPLPVTPAPQPVVAPTTSAPAAAPINSATAADDQLMNNAVASLKAAAPNASKPMAPAPAVQPAPAPVTLAPAPPMPQPVSTPAAPVTQAPTAPEPEEEADTANGTITHKKVIKPLDPGEEGSKPTLQDLLAAEEQKSPAALNQPPAANGLPHQPGNVVVPTAAPEQTGPLDPNNVAL